MSDWISDEEAERRQEARRAALRRGAAHAQSPLGRWAYQSAKAYYEGREVPPPPPRTAAERGPATEREQRLADGFIFADRADRIAEAQAEHRARRQRADAEVQQQDHLWQILRDSQGSDYADAWMNGDDAA
ncbi:hypothetical protein ACFO9E_25690 [Streptomyces maoxianensis]|uniref:Uncharacterized protein n=1 Tax=Streptomyces maoxianensis TaxID=1459942 RepID=A0ABV9GCA8_9ACTN